MNDLFYGNGIDKDYIIDINNGTHELRKMNIITDVNEILHDDLEDIDLDKFENKGKGFVYKIEQGHYIIIISSEIFTALDYFDKCMIMYVNQSLKIYCRSNDEIEYIVDHIKSIKRNKQTKRVYER